MTKFCAKSNRSSTNSREALLIMALFVVILCKDVRLYYCPFPVIESAVYEKILNCNLINKSSKFTYPHKSIPSRLRHAQKTVPLLFRKHVSVCIFFAAVEDERYYFLEHEYRRAVSENLSLYILATLTICTNLIRSQFLKSV